MKSFALISPAGYVAPRHVRAIYKLGHRLVAAYDISDSVGMLDGYFPDCYFFDSYERFDRYLDKLGHLGKPIDYLVICSPNYLHDAHVRLALRVRFFRAHKHTEILYFCYPISSKLNRILARRNNRIDSSGWPSRYTAHSIDAHIPYKLIEPGIEVTSCTKVQHHFFPGVVAARSLNERM